jgi:uncharacterized protein YwgA
MDEREFLGDVEMDRKQIGLKLVMTALDLPDTVESFDNRLIIQKAVYLAQAAGINLGYFYHWYLHGPYCPALTRDVYAIVSEGQSEVSRWCLDQQSIDKLKRLRTIIPAGESKAKQLELMASVHFLIHHKQTTSSKPSEIVTVLKRFNKEFSEPQVQQAMDKLTSHELISSE